MNGKQERNGVKIEKKETNEERVEARKEQMKY